MSNIDEQLVAAYIAGGDMRLLEKLVERHMEYVRNLIYAMVLNGSDADDLTQETFIKAAAALPRFKQQSSFKTWIYRIAVNTTRNFMRRKGRLELHALHDMAELAERAPGPDKTAVSQEETRQLLKMIGRLSPCLRRAFVLVGVHEINPREAARMEGCFTATMYRRVHVARRQLRQWLHEEGNHE